MTTANRLSDIRRRLADIQSANLLSARTFAELRLHDHAPDDIAWLLARCERLEAALRYIQNAYGDPFAEDVVTTEAREALKE